MSVVAGDEFPVNSFTTGRQILDHYAPGKVAVSADGDFVVVWYSEAQDSDGSWGVYGQRYNAAGVAQQPPAGVPQGTGTEFRVHTTIYSTQAWPTVAMDADGDFVVTWTSYAQDGDSAGVYAQRYNAAGVPQGTEFRVNTTTAGKQIFAVVAMDADGDFVITWTGYDQDGTGQNVYAQRYNAEGVPQGNEFRVNTVPAGDQSYSRVAMTASGDFVIAWAGPDDDQRGIYFRRYNADGTAKDAAEWRVNTEQTGDQAWPAVAVDATGDFVVSWASQGEDLSSWGIYHRRYNAAGVPQDIARPVNTFTAGEQNWPTVAMDAAGNYVITWSGVRPDASDFEIYARRYNAAGVSQDGQEFPVNADPGDGQYDSSVAMNPDGDFVVAWTTLNASGTIRDVHARRFDETTHTVGPVVSGVYVAGDTHQVTEGERLVSDVPQLVVAFSRDLSTAGGATGANSVTNPANWQLTRTGKDISNRITGITFGLNAATGHYEAVLTFATPLVVGHYVLTAKSAIQDTAGLALDGNYDATSGDNFSRNFSIASIGRVRTQGSEEFAVNTYTTGSQRVNDQTAGSVAVDGDGDFVVTWSSEGHETSGWGWGVHARRYNSSGEAQGDEFPVNTYTVNDQMESAVAMDAGGNFVITWAGLGREGYGWEVYARRYDADGNPKDQTDVLVNSSVGGDQRAPAVAMDPDGDFVITWRSYLEDGSGWDVYARRYNAAGQSQGNQFKVNTYTVNQQMESAVAMDALGNFVVTWAGLGREGYGWEVYARRYDADGNPKDQTDVLVNSSIVGDQDWPAIAMDVDGDYVITWQSTSEDGSVRGAYARRYNAAGVAHGAEFRVNSYTGHNQGSPAVAMDDDGDFVVSWPSYGEYGSGYDIYAQRYSAAGVPQGTVFRVNSYTSGTQGLSSVAMDSDGDFVVTWSSYNQVSVSPPSLWDVYAQRYGAVNSPPQANAGGPYSVDEGGSVMLDGSGTFDPDQLANTLTYQWDLDGDGIFGETGASATRGDEVGVSPTFRATGLDGPGSVAVMLKVTDDQGATDTDVMGITIDNLAPTATLSNSGFVQPGEAVTVSFSGANDPSSADTAAGFHYSYATSEGGLAATYATALDGTSKQFTFGSVGSFTVYGRIFDDDNGYTQRDTLVVVSNNVAPTATLGNGGAVAEGSAGSVSFSNPYDPSPSDTAAGFHYAYDFNNDGTFDLGDGTYVGGTTAASATVPATYLDDGPGSRTVKGRILDVQGGYNDYTTTITINNVPPMATFSNNGPVDEGVAVTVSFSNASDPSSADQAAGLRYSFALDSYDLAISYTAAGSVSSAQFTFNDPGIFTVYGRIFDNDNWYTDYETSVHVLDITSPTVARVWSSYDGIYTAGAVIPITVTFNEPVFVTTVTGVPGLTLETGVYDAWAGYASGSGTTSLVFDYTVGAGQLSADLDYVSNSSLALNGGTIRDAAGNNAVVTLPNPGAAGSLGANNSVMIDTAQPTAALADPLNGGDIWDRTIGNRGYIDVTLSDVGPSGLDVTAILAGGPVFTLSGAAATGVTVNGGPQQMDATTFRYTLTGRFTPGAVGVTFNAGTFHDNAGNANPAGPGLGFNVVRTVAVSDAVAVTERSTGKVYASFLVDLYWPSDQPVTVQYVTGGSAPNTVAAVPGRDYVARRGTLTFKPGQTAKTVKVLVRDDKIFEDAETFLVTLTNPKGAAAGQTVATGTILDNDPPPRMVFKDVTISEGKWVNVIVSLSGVSGKPVSVHYATADGTATAGSDYTAIADTVLTFLSGETKKTFRLTTLQDQVHEGTEKFVVNFTSAQNATLSRPSLTATIKDNDPKPKPSALARLASPALAIDEVMQTLGRTKKGDALLLFEPE